MGISNRFSVDGLMFVEGLLAVQEGQRLTVEEAMHHRWFASYYNTYYPRILKKMKADRKKLQQRKFVEMAKIFPFYQLPDGR